MEDLDRLYQILEGKAREHDRLVEKFSEIHKATRHLLEFKSGLPIDIDEECGRESFGLTFMGYQFSVSMCYRTDDKGTCAIVSLRSFGNEPEDIGTPVPGTLIFDNSGRVTTEEGEENESLRYPGPVNRWLTRCLITWCKNIGL